MSANVLVLPNRGDYFTVEGERPVLANPGIYALRYSHYETARLHGGRAGKVVVWFTICEMGPHFERPVAAYYNAAVTSAKRRRGGNFKVGWRSRLVREYALVEGLPARTDRIRLDLLGRHLLEGRLATVTHDDKQRAIPAAVQYSVVAELTGVCERGR
jgi:hypothetical protein